MPRAEAEPRPADEDVVRTLAEIEKASTTALPAENEPIVPGSQGSVLFRSLPPKMFFAAVIAVAAAVVSMNFLGQRLSSSGHRSTYVRSTGRRAPVDPNMQAEAEQLLQRLSSGSASAADEILGKSTNWTRKTERRSRALQWITAALNSPELSVRKAALQAELALDGVPLDESGFNMLEQASAIPSQRAWALWTLGALGNRGVAPERAAKVVGAYLADPQVDVRASAVDGLALLGTDETIPMMLDRFRNDPSPVVQERAACDIAESGMYTHEQRMTAAATLITWLDDSLINAQQRAWTVQALHDISGQSFGSDSSAWRTWYESAAH
jgi:HEAT repeat protein